MLKNEDNTEKRRERERGRDLITSVKPLDADIPETSSVRQ